MDNRPSYNAWIYYAVAPAMLVLICLGCYAYGPFVLQQVMCPDVISWMPLRSRRELGMVEGLTHLSLLAGAVLAIQAAFKPRFDRWFFALVGVGFSVWFLEEIDYGWHYAYLLIGRRPWQGFNLHNDVGGLNAMLGTFSYWGFLALSILSIALVGQRRRDGWRSWLPNLALVSSFPIFAGLEYLSWYLFTFTPHLLGRPMNQGSLSGSTREFVELYCALMAFLYVADVRWRLTHSVEK